MELISQETRDAFRLFMITRGDGLKLNSAGTLPDQVDKLYAETNWSSRESVNRVFRVWEESFKYYPFKFQNFREQALDLLAKDGFKCGGGKIY